MPDIPDEKFDEAVEKHRKTAEDARMAEYNWCVLDSLFYNSLTIGGVFLAGLAAWPWDGWRLDAASKVLVATSGAMVAIERAVGFGKRWQRHSTAEAAYASVVTRLDNSNALEREKRSEFLETIVSRIEEIRKLAANV